MIQSAKNTARPASTPSGVSVPFPPPRRPRFRQPTAVTRRQNQPPSEWKRQPLFAVSLSPVPFPRFTARRGYLSTLPPPPPPLPPLCVSTPLFFSLPLIASFSSDVFLRRILRASFRSFSSLAQLNARYVSEPASFPLHALLPIFYFHCDRVSFSLSRTLFPIVSAVPAYVLLRGVRFLIFFFLRAISQRALFGYRSTN